MNGRDLKKAALRGEPSYVWRAGQQRRFKMILQAAGNRTRGSVLENGCGVGIYLEHLAPHTGTLVGLEYDFQRAIEARKRSQLILNAASEALPLPPETFDLIISHEVLEHVRNDALAIREMIRLLKIGGRLVLFVPNRGYPFETHGIYWRGRYVFGNIPLVNYLPKKWRNKLVPHVRVYTKHDLELLFAGMTVKHIQRTVIFGAYDNLIAKFGRFGRLIRTILQSLEGTPLKRLGLSHFWVVEKTRGADYE